MIYFIDWRINTITKHNNNNNRHILAWKEKYNTITNKNNNNLYTNSEKVWWNIELFQSYKRPIWYWWLLSSQWCCHDVKWWNILPWTLHFCLYQYLWGSWYRNNSNCGYLGYDFWYPWIIWQINCCYNQTKIFLSCSFKLTLRFIFF